MSPPALTPRVLWYGSDRDPPQRIPLRAGPVELFFESGELRRLRIGDREVVRRIYSAVRDRNWGTVPPVVSNLRAEVAEDSFDLSFEVACVEREIEFVWTGRARGERDGTITFSMDGEARSTFLRNRLGFCVLHPVRECPGAAVRITRPDGSVFEGAFPKAIAPENPFPEMTAVAHQASPDLWVEVRFEGDTFEFEDQRNWLDGSFKIFCTPLRIPYPVEVPAGTRISQSVTVSLRGRPPAPRPSARSRAVAVEVGASRLAPLPAMGLGSASHGRPLAPEEAALLRELRLSHLRADLDLASPSCRAALERASADARAAGAKLEAALFLSGDGEEEFERFAGVVREVRPPVLTWLIFHRSEKATTARWARAARERLAGLVPGARFGGGTDNDFAELNRDRPPVEHLDLASFAFNPQVHGFDELTLLESLECHRQALETMRGFSGNLLLAVSPVTLRPRFPVNATGPVDETPPGELPFEVDPRQRSLFGAAWTLASLKNFAEGGAASLTYYETTGPRGVMETLAGSAVPGKFPSLPGSVFPVWHVFADLGECAGGGHLLASRSSEPAAVESLALEGAGRRTLLLANLTPEPQEVEAGGIAGQVRLRVLDETTAAAAMTEPLKFRREPGEARAAEGGKLRLELRPFALARIDWQSGG